MRAIRASDGSVLNSSIGGSSATGGFPGLCLDNPEVRAAAEKFLTALVEHYRNHPALLGYDLWNENTYNGGSPTKMYCYCDATKRKLREWLRARYETPQALGTRLESLQLRIVGRRGAAATISAAIPRASTGCSSGSTMRSNCFTGARSCSASSIRIT